jgi:hypothetical protein
LDLLAEQCEKAEFHLLGFLITTIISGHNPIALFSAPPYWTEITSPGLT